MPSVAEDEYGSSTIVKSDIDTVEGKRVHDSSKCGSTY